MKSSGKFPFERARRVTADEVDAGRRGIESALGTARVARRGRPARSADEKTKPVSIRFSPKVIGWAKRQADERGIGYQTFISKTLEGMAIKALKAAKKTPTQWAAKKSTARSRKKHSS